jgi:Protein of unknown function (DUF1573)
MTTPQFGKLVGCIVVAWLMLAVSCAAALASLSQQQLVLRQLAVVLDQPVPNNLLPSVHNSLDEVKNALGAMGMQGDIHVFGTFGELPKDQPLLTLDNKAVLCLVRREGTTMTVFAYPTAPTRVASSSIAQSFFPRKFIPVSKKTTFLLGGRGVMQLSPNVLDFGSLEQGGSFDGSFSIQNAGSVPVIIKDVRGSCGCMDVELTSSPRLEPGAAGHIHVHFSSNDHVGVQEYFIVVTTDGDSAMAQFTGYVKTDLTYYPRQIDFDDPSGRNAQQIHFLARSGIDVEPVENVVVGDRSLTTKVTRAWSKAWHVREDIVTVTLDKSHLSPGEHDMSLAVNMNAGFGDPVLVQIPVSVWIDSHN